MNETGKHVEDESVSQDISTEFLQMTASQFRDFIRTLKDASSLSITIDWVDVPTARRLKAFLEDPNAYKWNQQRSAAIRATKEQHEQELNAFASGVEWEEV